MEPNSIGLNKKVVTKLSVNTKRRLPFAAGKKKVILPPFRAKSVGTTSAPTTATLPVNPRVQITEAATDFKFRFNAVRRFLVQRELPGIPTPNVINVMCIDPDDKKALIRDLKQYAEILAEEVDTKVVTKEKKPVTRGANTKQPKKSKPVTKVTPVKSVAGKWVQEKGETTKSVPKTKPSVKAAAPKKTKPKVEAKSKAKKK